MSHQRMKEAGGVWHEPPSVGANTESLQAQIGMQLRAVYETMIAEPIPDRFLELMQRLEKGPAAPVPPDASVVPTSDAPVVDGAKRGIS